MDGLTAAAGITERRLADLGDGLTPVRAGFDGVTGSVTTVDASMAGLSANTETVVGGMARLSDAIATGVGPAWFAVSGRV